MSYRITCTEHPEITETVDVPVGDAWAIAAAHGLLYHGSMGAESVNVEMVADDELVAAVTETLATVDTSGVQPHVADKIEPGAILYSSWGYDQTNVDYYMVTRTTKSSAWIVPMQHIECPSAGYSPMSGHTTPLEPMTHTNWCQNCKHAEHRHQGGHVCTDNDYGHAECECREFVPTPIKPKMHRIRHSTYGESLSLTSYSGAYLWDGKAKYASHYA